MASLLPDRPNPAGAPLTPFDPTFAGGFGEHPEPPDQESLDLRAIWAVLRRYWLLILGCVAVAGALGWYLTDRMTPIYQATASLRIAANESSVPGLEVLQGLGGQGSEVNTEMQVLKSRALADSVVARLGMRLSVLQPRRVPRSRLVVSAALAPTADTGRIIIESSGGRVTLTGPDSVPVAGQPGGTVRVGPATLVLARAVAVYPRAVLALATPAAATSALMGGLSVTRPSRDANILVVSVRHSDPEMAVAAANALLDAFLEQRVATRRTGARSTVDFLRVQLDTLSIELRNAEDSLKAFREQEQVVAIETQAQVSVGKLAELKAESEAVWSELQALNAVLAGNLSTPEDDVGGSAYRRLLAFPTLLRNPTVSTLLTAQTTLENQRATLLTRRTMRDPDVVTLTGQIAAVEAQMRGLVISYTDGLRAQVAAYDRTLAQSQTQLNAIPAKEVQLARLMRSTVILGELSVLLQTRLKEAEIARAVEDPSARVVDHAVPPGGPVLPRRKVNLALSLMLGLFLSLGIVYARETLDTKVHSREDLQAITQLPVLGVIPHFELDGPTTVGRVGRRLLKRRASSGATGTTVLVSTHQPASSVVEAYRALRTTLAFALPERPPKIVMLTSPSPADGKSTSTANLAASLAQQRLKVLVIDADMRRGALHRLVGGWRRPGLSELLTGIAEFPSVIQPLTIEGLGRIDLISTGTVPPNPTDLLSSHRFTELLQAAEPLYDTILIDTPPVNAFADALVVAPHADGVVLVVRGDRTERGAVRFAVEQIASVRGKVMGTVLNDFDTRRSDAYGGYYYYTGTDYGPATEE